MGLTLWLSGRYSNHAQPVLVQHSTVANKGDANPHRIAAYNEVKKVKYLHELLGALSSMF